MTDYEQGTKSVVARNSALNLVGRIVPALVGVLALPIIVHGLGAEGFGVLSVAWVLLNYSSIFDLGLGRATVKFTAEHLNPDKVHKLPGLVWSSLALQLLQGTAGGVLIGLSVPFIVDHIFRVPPSLVGEARAAFLILAASLPILLVGNAIRGVLEAGQRFDLVNYVAVPASVSFYIFAALAVALHVSVAGIVLLQVLIRTASAIAYLVLSLREFPFLRETYSISWQSVRPLASYGGWCTVSGIAGPTFGELERFMIASFISVGALSFYSAPYELITKLVVFPASVIPALFPFFSYHSGGSRDIISDVASRTLKYLLFFMTPFTVVFAFFAREILQLWLGDKFAAQSTVVLQLLAISFFLNVLAQIPYTLVQALGRPDLKAMLDLFALPAYAALAWILMRPMGISGAALAKLLISSLDAGFLFWFAWRLKAFPVRQCFSGPLSRLLIASGGLVLSVFAVESFHPALPMLGLLLAACLGVYSGAFWVVAVDEDERIALRGLSRMLVRS